MEMIVNYNIKRYDFAFLFWNEGSNMQCYSTYSSKLELAFFLKKKMQIELARSFNISSSVKINSLLCLQLQFF